MNVFYPTGDGGYTRKPTGRLPDAPFIRYGRYTRIIHKSAKMIKINDTRKCSGCMTCLQVCPNAAIAPVQTAGFAYPTVDRHKCSDCGKCEAVCPYRAELPVCRSESAWIAYTDQSVRAASSAGGVFAVLALNTLARGGVVFGAAYTSEVGCAQTCAETVGQLSALIGRKYVVSHTSDSFVRTKEYLLAEREVLYSGTPCQIAALKRYLGAPYAGLLCVEVGCGGVAGDDVWRAFLQMMHNPQRIELTNRIDQENRAGIRFVYADGSQTVLARKDTAIHKAITLGLGIRPSCERCTFGRRKSAADLTLRRYNPALDDNELNIRRQPMTLVLCRTTAGAQAFADCAEMLQMREITREEAYRHIARSDREKKCADRSRAFLGALDQLGFEAALKRYSTRGPAAFLSRTAKRIFLK